MNLVITVVLLWVVYLALSADVSWPNLALGLLVAAVVAWLLRLRAQSLRWTHLARKPLDIAVYLFYLGIDLLRSGLQVARLVLDPKLPIDPGIVAVCTPVDGEIGQALSGHAMSLTPGDIIVEYEEDGTLYVHSLVLERAPTADDLEWGKRWKALQRVLS